MKLSTLRSLVVKLVLQLRRNGLRATVGKGVRFIRERNFLDETHLWYGLELESERTGTPLPEGLQIIRGDFGNVHLIDELPGTVSLPSARQRLQSGHELWMVVDGGGCVFACWVLRGSAPVIAASKGEISLPPGTVCFEDAVTSPGYRGRGMILPAAWTAMLNDLENRGTRTVITKVEQDNRAMRWAVRRVGFRETATMRHRRSGPRRYTSLKTDQNADWLAEELLK